MMKEMYEKPFMDLMALDFIDAITTASTPEDQLPIDCEDED